jgi:hypothetical protein
LCAVCGVKKRGSADAAANLLLYLFLKTKRRRSFTPQGEKFLAIA